MKLGIFRNWFAIVIVLAAFVAAWNVSNPEEAVEDTGSLLPSRRSSEVSRATPSASIRKWFQAIPSPEVPQDGPRVLEISKTHPRHLDWSLDELESYLEEQKSVLTDSQMFARLAYILPDPAGSTPELNRLLPGSISIADQARLCMKYADSEDHMSLISGVWSRCRNTASGYPDYNFLGEITSVLEPGHLRYTVIRQHVFHCFNDYGRMAELLASEDPIYGMFPNYAAVNGDDKYIISGLNIALAELVFRKEAEKSDLIGLVSRSSLDEGIQAEMIDYVNTWAR